MLWLRILNRDRTILVRNLSSYANLVQNDFRSTLVFASWWPKRTKVGISDGPMMRQVTRNVMGHCLYKRSDFSNFTRARELFGGRENGTYSAAELPRTLEVKGHTSDKFTITVSEGSQQSMNIQG
ncbi:Hypothetical protein NTJ_05325 [Nesidiocoris tenuis]|uniref:Uncharacterized protein n=1 Tax=Nesidiocoris tenuis TaxID=355587 RepID=A0ABN7AJT8_9HEMI|nr:Hypothetical protein NTJ_05325 [Nesidiocoris tenuis]